MTFFRLTLAAGVVWIVVVSIISLSLGINFWLELVIMAAGGFLIGWEGGRASVIHRRRKREEFNKSGGTE